jgi:hypothetical protein
LWNDIVGNVQVSGEEKREWKEKGDGGEGEGKREADLPTLFLESEAADAIMSASAPASSAAQKVELNGIGA